MQLYVRKNRRITVGRYGAYNKVLQITFHRSQQIVDYINILEYDSQSQYQFRRQGKCRGLCHKGMNPQINQRRTELYCSLASKARAAREQVQFELARAVLASEQRAASSSLFASSSRARASTAQAARSLAAQASCTREQAARAVHVRQVPTYLLGRYLHAYITNALK